MTGAVNNRRTKKMRTLSLDRLSRIIQRSQTTEFLSLASTPNEEDCTPAGQNLDEQKMECTALINQYKRIYGTEPDGSEFIIIENFHDFGIYYEAGIIYEYSPEPDTWQGDEETEQPDQPQHPAEMYALQCETTPDKWDDEAKAELRQAGHSKYQPAKVIPIAARNNPKQIKILP